MTEQSPFKWANICSIRDKTAKQIPSYQASMYLFKVNNRSNRRMCEICSQLTIKTMSYKNNAFIVNFEQISYI